MVTELCNRCVIRDVCDLPGCMRPQPPKCQNFVARPMTHFDRLHAMSAEEMAVWLDLVRNNKDYPIYSTDWEEWLKEEIVDG